MSSTITIKQRIQKIARNIAALFLLFFAIPDPANALFFLGPIAVATIAVVVFYILQYLGSMLFSLASYFVSIILNLNLQILSPTNSLVTIGWEITRDIANLGFVLVIIIIALATIVRYQDYGAKKLLPRLISAAILVNFSLSIAGIFIGFSNTLTRYFMTAVDSSAAMSTSQFTKTLSGAFNPQNLFTEPEEPDPVDPDDEVGGFAEFGTPILMNISASVFTVIFIYLATFVLFAFALMLLIRYVALSILMVLAPIAWLFWVIPQLSNQFSKWWNKFMQWIFFAPAVSFFFYLALVSINQVNKGMAAVSKTEFFKNGVLSVLAQQGVRMFVLVGFLIGGLIVAQSMSITGAAGAMGLLKGASDKTKKWLATKTKEGATLAGRKALTAGTDAEGKTALNRLASKLEGNKIAQQTGFAGAARFASVLSSKAQAKGAKNVEEEKKKYDNWTKEDLAAHAKRVIYSGDHESNAALMLSLAEKGGLDMLDESAKKRGIEALKKVKKGDDILIYTPHWYKEFAKSSDPQDIVAKGKEVAAKLEKLPKGNKSPEFKQFLTDFAQDLNQGIIDQIGSTTLPNGEELRTTIKTALKTKVPSSSNIEKLRNEIKEITEDIEVISAQIETKQAELEKTSDPTQKDKLKNEILQLVKGKQQKAQDKKQKNKEIEKIEKRMSPEERKAFNKLENINKQPNYKSIP